MRTHTYARTQAHAHALTFIGHVMRTSTRASLTVNGHVTRTHTYARTQANAQEHELSQSSVSRCTQAHAHALPRACALNGPEAYFYYYLYASFDLVLYNRVQLRVFICIFSIR